LKLKFPTFSVQHILKVKFLRELLNAVLSRENLLIDRLAVKTMFIDIFLLTNHPERSYFESRLTQLFPVESLLIDILAVEAKLLGTLLLTQYSDREVTLKVTECR